MTTRTKVRTQEYVTDHGHEKTQYNCTIPMDLAEAMDLDDETVIEWSIATGNALRMDFER